MATAGGVDFVSPSTEEGDSLETVSSSDGCDPMEPSSSETVDGEGVTTATVKPERKVSVYASPLPPCKICGGKASGLHYGVNTCEACKGFFRRAIKYQRKYQCYRKKRCDVVGGRSVRTSCPFCRLQKCLDMGMAHSAIKTGRYSHAKRTENIMEVKRLQLDSTTPIGQDRLLNGNSNTSNNSYSSNNNNNNNSSGYNSSNNSNSSFKYSSNNNNSSTSFSSGSSNGNDNNSKRIFDNGSSFISLDDSRSSIAHDLHLSNSSDCFNGDSTSSSQLRNVLLSSTILKQEELLQTNANGVIVQSSVLDSKAGNVYPSTYDGSLSDNQRLSSNYYNGNTSYWSHTQRDSEWNPRQMGFVGSSSIHPIPVNLKDTDSKIPIEEISRQQSIDRGPGTNFPTDLPPGKPENVESPEAGGSQATQLYNLHSKRQDIQLRDPTSEVLNSRNLVKFHSLAPPYHESVNGYPPWQQQYSCNPVNVELPAIYGQEPSFTVLGLRESGSTVSAHPLPGAEGNSEQSYSPNKAANRNHDQSSFYQTTTNSISIKMPRKEEPPYSFRNSEKFQTHCNSIPFEEPLREDTNVSLCSRISHAFISSLPKDNHVMNPGSENNLYFSHKNNEPENVGANTDIADCTQSLSPSPSMSGIPTIRLDSSNTVTDLEEASGAFYMQDTSESTPFCISPHQNTNVFFNLPVSPSTSPSAASSPSPSLLTSMLQPRLFNPAKEFDCPPNLLESSVSPQTSSDSESILSVSLGPIYPDSSYVRKSSFEEDASKPDSNDHDMNISPSISPSKQQDPKSIDVDSFLEGDLFLGAIDIIEKAYVKYSQTCFGVDRDVLLQWQLDYLKHHKARRETFGLNSDFITDEDYKEIYERTGLDIDNRKEEINIINIGVTKFFQDLTRFILSVPGSNKLHSKDIVELVYASYTEIWFLHSFCGVNSDLQVVIMPMGKPYFKSEFAWVMSEEFADTVFKHAPSFQSLTLDTKIMAIWKVVVLLSSDRVSLKEPRRVSRLQQIYLDLLKQYTRLEFSQEPGLFGRIVDATIRLREVGHYSKAPRSFSVEFLKEEILSVISEVESDSSLDVKRDMQCD